MSCSLSCCQLFKRIRTSLHPLCSLYDWKYIVPLVTIDRAMSFADITRKSLFIYSQSFTFRAFNHIKIFRAAGAVLTAVSRTYRTTHNVASLIEYNAQTMNAHAPVPTRLNQSCSIKKSAKVKIPIMENIAINTLSRK